MAFIAQKKKNKATKVKNALRQAFGHPGLWAWIKPSTLQNGFSDGEEEEKEQGEENIQQMPLQCPLGCFPAALFPGDDRYQVSNVLRKKETYTPTQT